MTKWEQYYQRRERQEALNKIRSIILHKKNRWFHLDHRHNDGQSFFSIKHPITKNNEMSIDVTHMLDNQDKYEDVADFVIKQLEQQGADRYNPVAPF